MRTLMQQLSANISSCSSGNKLINEHSATSSSVLSNPNEQFMSLDALPDPPCISIDEIRQLNQAFNKLESSLPLEQQANKEKIETISLRSERSNSFDSIASCSSNTTLDVNATKRPVSKCSTVDVRIKGEAYKQV